MGNTSYCTYRLRYLSQRGEEGENTWYVHRKGDLQTRESTPIHPSPHRSVRIRDSNKISNSKMCAEERAANRSKIAQRAAWWAHLPRSPSHRPSADHLEQHLVVLVLDCRAAIRNDRRLRGPNAEVGGLLDHRVHLLQRREQLRVVVGAL